MLAQGNMDSLIGYMQSNNYKLNVLELKIVFGYDNIIYKLKCYFKFDSHKEELELIKTNIDYLIQRDKLQDL